MSKKKKNLIILSIVIGAFAIMGIVYALLSDNMQLINKITIGSVQIENLDLNLRNSNDQDINVMSPADIDTLSWTTKNIGTSGVLTRHTLEIYWEDEVNQNPNSEMLYLYPANIAKETILLDYEKGEEAQYMISTEKISKEIDGIVKSGIKYQFIGDTLDGTSMKNISNEVNYNSAQEEGIDKNISTDDANDTIDTISFRILMNPKLSYLYQGMNISIKVTTEAMQYTEDGSAEWKVVDIQEIP